VVLGRKYIGDGGAALEALFQRWPWREIRNCPGRYVVGRGRSTEALATPPSALVPAGVAVTRHPGTGSGGDPVLVALFPGGGGLVTFEKRTEGNIRYVHTLNTASGLKRKLESLGIDALAAARG
jgi:hypothetical protein